MSFDSKDISADSLKLLRYVHLHPFLNTKLTTTVIYVNIFLLALVMVLAIKGISDSYNEDMFFMSECFHTCILKIHTIGKILIMQNYKSDLKMLLEKKANFWEIDDCDKAVQKECLKIFHFVKFFSRYFISMALLTAIFFDLQPLISGNLPAACYVPEGWFNYLAVIIWYSSYIIAVCLPGTDIFFCSLVSAVIVQFKLLTNKYKNITSFNGSLEKQLWNGLKILVDYHNNLISYCKDLNIIFRNIFVLQFGISIASCALSVFIFMQPGSWTNRITFLLYFLAIMIETGFYCVPLEIVVNAAQEVNNAVYNTEWYKINSTQFKKCLTLIISKAQEPIVFSGYGMFHMNLRTYVTIMKTVFTFYTYLQSTEKLSKK